MIGRIFAWEGAVEAIPRRCRWGGGLVAVAAGGGGGMRLNGRRTQQGLAARQ